MIVDTDSEICYSPEAHGQTLEMLGQVTPLPPSAQPRYPLAIKDANTPSASAQRSSATSHLTILDGLNDEDLEKIAQEIPESAVQGLRAKILPTGTPYSEGESMIAEEEVAPDRFNATDAQYLAASTAADDELEEEAVLFFDNTDSELANTSMARSEEFVLRYAKYNVVNQYHLAQYCQRSWTSDISDDLIAKYCMIGGSREHPQPTIHYCSQTPGCPFESFEKAVVKFHMVSCTALRVEQVLIRADKHSDFMCPYDECTYVISFTSGLPAKSLAQHVKDIQGAQRKGL